jgi:hypothetical protein
VNRFRLGCGLFLAIVAITIAFFALQPKRSRWLLSRQPTYAELIANLGGEEVAAVLRQPDRAVAVLLEPPNFRSWNAHEFKVVSDAIAVAPEVSSEIAQTLVSPDQFREIPPKTCLPIYGVRLTYFAKEGRVDIYFCFECALFATYLNEKPVGGGSFDFCYHRLIDAVRKIYPDNARLAKLATEHRD